MSDSKYNFLDNKVCDTISLRVQIAEQNKTIGQIRKRVSNKYNILAAGCKDTALFWSKISSMMCYNT